MKKTILAGLIALGVASSASAQRPSATLEVMAGQDSAITDTKLSVPVRGDVSIFARNRLGTDYTGINWDFSLVDLNLYTKGPATVYVEGQYVKGGPVLPYAGVILSAQKGDLSVTAIPSTRLNEQELLVQTISSYVKPIAGKANIVARAETFVGKTGGQDAWATERIRIGIKKGSYEAGLALDISQAKRQRPSYFAGVYARKSF